MGCISHLCRGAFFYARGKHPAGQGGNLPYFIAYCRKIEDFKPEISLFFPIAKTVGGGGIIKNEKYPQQRSAKSTRKRRKRKEITRLTF